MATAYDNPMRSFLYRKIVNIGVATKAWRVALPPLEKVALNFLVNKGDPIRIGPRRQREDKFYIASNTVRAAFKAYDQGSPAVRDRIINLFLKEFIGSKHRGIADEFEKEYGVRPPSFITLSPGGNCNLHCKDCYAASLSEKMPSLSAETVEFILEEKYKKWGSWFTVISGGEPFMWRDGKTDIIEIAKKHPEQYFLIYTNGTLIDKKLAARLAEVGNITTAISVEGFEKETDDRRGAGTHKRILSAFENLREAGVPFGISVTATPENAELLISKEFTDFYFKGQGVLYEWLFQYMPIGRGADVERQIPADMRRRMWDREQEIVRKDRLFFADFWNSGTLSSGCMAGGRHGGYLYIDWIGNIYPCVFVPFFKHNINDLISERSNLTEALFSDLFQGIRDWQRSYSYMRPPGCRGNEIRPCIIRDHHKIAHDLVIKTKSKPGYPSAAICLEDSEYYNAMLEYDDELARLLDPIWESQYLESSGKSRD